MSIKLSYKVPYGSKEDVIFDEHLARQTFDGVTVRAKHMCFEITLTTSTRKYKDGTSLWMTYIRCPNADSKEVITLCKTRGSLLDAIENTEKLLFNEEVQYGVK